MVLSEDGSYTAYSKEYGEHYHSTKDGALNESLFKHIIPAFKLKQNQKELHILDICFGLGLNTLSTIYYAKKIDYRGEINIYSPELDAALVSSLSNFIYPKEFDSYKEIIASLCKENFYRDENICIEIFLGDARKYIKTLKPKSFDIVYQDAFSPKANPTLWTYEYFKEIKTVLKDDGILTTYSTALATRLALYENGFNIYLNEGNGFRASTVASLSKLDIFSSVDMKHKIECNPHIRALRDTQKSDN
jgi:tRNA U34 5-methylaminomethyl-2-thiouridine-forming methyltransferase MnmC